jgi:hypothetical protein
MVELETGSRSTVRITAHHVGGWSIVHGGTLEALEPLMKEVFDNAVSKNQEERYGSSESDQKKSGVSPETRLDRYSGGAL